MPGECRCRLGWAGPTCKECQVLPGCQHGSCTKPLECKCHPGWTGILCHIRKHAKSMAMHSFNLSGELIFPIQLFILQLSVPKTAANRMDIVRSLANVAAKSVGSQKIAMSATLTLAARTAIVEDRGNAIASEFQCCLNVFARWTQTFSFFCFCLSTGPATVECSATKVEINRKWGEHAISFDAFSLFRSFVFSELNYCELNEGTCQNDGKCTSVTEDAGAFKCECPSGYRGKNCENAPPQMYPSANATSAAVRPSKVPVIITSLKPHNATETSSSTVKDGEHDDEIDNEAKWAGRLV